jgi:hypothetical protein
MRPRPALKQNLDSVSGVAERQGAGRRFQREICRAHPVPSESAGSLCVSPSAVAGDAEKADFT